jgi:beta-xylosidase
MRRVTPLVLVAVLLGGLLTAGCGGAATIDVAGKTYLNSQEEADSRTILFNPDGTFLYSIVTVQKTWKGAGTYKVADGKVTLTFNPQGEITELTGKTLDYGIDGSLLVDPDGSRWSVL